MADHRYAVITALSWEGNVNPGEDDDTPMRYALGMVVDLTTYLQTEPT